MKVPRQPHVITLSEEKYTSGFHSARQSHQDIVTPLIPKLDAHLRQLGAISLGKGQYPSFEYPSQIPRKSRVEWKDGSINLEFTPKGWVQVPIDGEQVWCPLEWKVVKLPDHNTLALKRNPYPTVQYPLGEWAFDTQTYSDARDDGGIWTATLPSDARSIEKYMWEKYEQATTTLAVALLNPVFSSNGTRTKSAAVLPITAEALFVVDNHVVKEP